MWLAWQRWQLLQDLAGHSVFIVLFFSFVGECAPFKHFINLKATCVLKLTLNKCLSSALFVYLVINKHLKLQYPPFAFPGDFNCFYFVSFGGTLEALFFYSFWHKHNIILVGTLIRNDLGPGMQSLVKVINIIIFSSFVQTGSDNCSSTY